MDNRDVARALREFSIYFEMDGVDFKPRAFEKAALAIEALDRSVDALWKEGGAKALQEIPSVGQGIAERIGELLETGHCSELEKFRKRTPVEVLELAAIEGVGPQKIRALYEELKIRNVDDLEKAARAGRIHAAPHFKEKSEQNILRGIEFYRQSVARHPIGTVLDLAASIEDHLRAVKGVQQAAVAGSIRRHKETIGDFDLLVASTDPGAVVRAFVDLPDVTHVYAKGATKTMVRLRNGMDADLRIVDAACFGAALLYFTGSKSHNIAIRKIAMTKHLKLSEYGLFRGSKRIAGAAEPEIYDALGLDYVPPELREDSGEVEAARDGKLPRLIAAGDLRGDLQTQTKWTDGNLSIEELVEAARALGLEYVAITDHTRDLAMARGSDEKKLRQQVREIQHLNAKLRGFRILSGAEVNIRRDGSLDVSDEMLAQLDVVGASVHALFDLPREEMTRRVIRAIENPNIDILFHPSTRQLGRRPAVEIDMDAVIAAAARTGTILEINAQPERLDLDDTHVRRAIESGVKLAVDSDAHNAGDLRFPRQYGIYVARRGWASKRDVINTLPLEKMLGALKPRKLVVTKPRARRVVAHA
ncbi:MAG TPA: DNA polymerase/3'-5' exonuclease PolX [Thermoanaerobaculia bacterium]|nr:DNA polymerase/3'-5' exonuclease PolX [Thermoanaerobaculia bacterium]